MKPVWAPGERVVVALPMGGGAAVFAALVSAVPVMAFFTFTREAFDPDGAVWVPFALAALGGGIWLGFFLARLLFGNTLILDWSTRTATVKGRRARSFPFADVTTVTLELSERHVRRVGMVFTAQVIVRTKTERLIVRHLGGDPSQKTGFVAQITPEAKQLARSLGRPLG